ncbi:MAG TPA: GAF domain-containing sensor histidine kinase [Polyangiaceae bacterium]
MSSEVEPKIASVGDERAGRLAEALRREQRISRALREVGTALGSTLDLDDLLELILAKLTELVEADRATLYLLDEAKGELVSRVVAGGEVRSIRMKLGHGVAGLVASTGEPIRIEDAYRDPRFEREWDLLTGYQTVNMLVAPLKNHVGRTIGVLQVLNKRGGGVFTSEDEALVGTLGTQAAVALDNSRLVLSLIQKNKQLLDTKEQLERKYRELSLLFELERATARATSVDELARATLEHVTRACDARAGALLLADEESGDLVERVFDRQSPERLERRPAKAGEGFLGAAMESSTPLLVEGDVGLLRLVAANVSTAVRLFNASRARELGERLTSIGRLLSQVIHDFKTPMTVISGYVQLMVDADERATRNEYSELILEQFDVLTAMQREVLEFARGETRIFVRRVFLKKFFADLERQLRLEIGGLPIELVISVDSKLVARFDEGRVARAVHNLARNALEAMAEKGGRLTIAAELREDGLAISIADNGPGIPKEIEDRVFQSFVTLGKRGGTGLGLAIVKKIVDEHGGRIELRNSSAGARFELVIPQPSRDAGAASAAPDSAPR